jgi:hypothetical protein
MMQTADVYENRSFSGKKFPILYGAVEQDPIGAGIFFDCSYPAFGNLDPVDHTKSVQVRYLYRNVFYLSSFIFTNIRHQKIFKNHAAAL